MQRLTQAKIGLFPEPKEIDFKCSCPDSAYLCKHLAAVMYGIGNRLDSSPELLFVLRGVEQSELIGEIAIGATESDGMVGQAANGENGLSADDLGSLFGIDLVSKPVESKKRSAKKLSTLQSKAISSAAVKRATKNVDKKTTAAKTKVTAVKRIKQGKARPPLTKPDSRPRGSSESLRQAIEALERSPAQTPANAVEVVAAKKRKNTPRKSELGKKPR